MPCATIGNALHEQWVLDLVSDLAVSTSDGEDLHRQRNLGVEQRAQRPRIIWAPRHALGRSWKRSRPRRGARGLRFRGKREPQQQMLREPEEDGVADLHVQRRGSVHVQDDLPRGDLAVLPLAAVAHALLSGRIDDEDLALDLVIAVIAARAHATVLAVRRIDAPGVHPSVVLTHEVAPHYGELATTAVRALQPLTTHSLVVIRRGWEFLRS